MANLYDVVDKATEYFEASDQDMPSDTVIEFAAQSAVDAINEIRRYDVTDDEGVACVEDKYLSRAARIAVYLVNKEGVDGAVSFNENGVGRVYEAGDIPPSLLKSVTPVCRGW